MVIRNLNPSDIESLKALHKENFPFPDLTNLLFMDKLVVEVDGKVAGAGLVRLTSEAILIMDEALPKVTRAKAVLLLADELLKKTQAQGMDECHVFVHSSNIKALCEHIGFKESKGGTPLIIHF